MKRIIALLLTFTMCFVLAACNNTPTNQPTENPTEKPFEPPAQPEFNIHQSGKCDVEGTNIVLSNDGITVNGAAISQNTDDDVYAARDIIYYPDGKDFTYGSGTVDDIRSDIIASDHTVLHITKPGTYILSGQLSAGQIFVDLGENAKSEPEAIVNLYLNGVAIDCEVAPALVFKSAYNSMLEDSEMGANIIVCEQSINILNGDYVACIYQPDSVIMNSDETAVEQYKVMHDYSGAIHSDISMKINGSGVLTVNGARNGISSAGHLLINGPSLFVNATRYGMYVSTEDVMNIQSGEVAVTVNGNTENTAMYSKGWININGGKVYAIAGSIGSSHGMFAEKEVVINHGSVFASSTVEITITSKQNYAVFAFDTVQPAGFVAMKQGDKEISGNLTNSFAFLLVSSDQMSAGDYTISHNNNKYRATPLIGDIVIEDPERDIYSEIITIKDGPNKFHVKTSS